MPVRKVKGGSSGANRERFTPLKSRLKSKVVLFMRVDIKEVVKSKNQNYAKVLLLRLQS